MATRHELLAWIGFGLVLGGIVWLGPLMFDQLTFFGDQAQEADAAAARALMPWPAALVAAGAGVIASGGRPLHGAVAALPLVAVALAWATPDALYQLLAYAITAPIAVGAALAVPMPLRGTAPRPLVAMVIVVAAAGAILATPFLAGMAVVAFLTWWGLSSRSRPAGRPRTLD